MADKNRAELEAENAELQEKITSLAKEISDNPLSNDGNFQKELSRVNRQKEKALSDLEALRLRVRDEAIERETIANDAIAAEKARLKEFGISKVNQDHHTRFRALPKSPGGQRDIFGDPTSPVFDLGVEFQYYNGGIYIPVQTVIEMAQSIGMLTEDQANDLNLELSTVKSQVEMAGAFAQELVDGISSHVDNFYSNLAGVVNLGANDVSDAESDDSNAGESAGQTPDANVGTKPAGVSADSKSESDFGNLK